MKINISLLFVAFLLIGFSSCRQKVTKGALKTGDVLKSSIEDFEKERTKLSEQVIESLAEAEASLAEENSELPEVARDFEKEWTSVQNRYNKLRKDFDRVGQNSEAYFNQLDELSGAINAEELRAEERGKNAELRKRWQVQYNDASQAVSKITEVLEAGNDFHMVLVASSIRMKLEKNVTELKSIAEQAKVLLADLESFTEAGRQLVEG